LLQAPHLAFGQAHEWALNFRTSPNVSVGIDAMATAKNGDIYVGGVFKDSLFIGSDTLFFTGSFSSARAIYLAKYDKDSNFIWSKALTSVVNAELNDIKINKNGKILIYGSYRTSLAKPSVSFDTFSLSRARSVFLAFMDTSGQFTDAVDLAYSGSSIRGWRIDLGPNDEIFTYNYLSAGYLGSYTINSTVSPVSVKGNITDWVICKHDSAGKVLLWNNTLNSRDLAMGGGGFTVDENGDVYYGFRANKNRTINGVSSGRGTPIFLIKLNGINGNAIKTIKSLSKSNGQLQQLAVIGNRLFIQGWTINDSFNILGKSFKAIGVGLSKRPFYYLACLNGLDSVIWHLTSTRDKYTNNTDSRLTLSGKFIYSSFKTYNADSFKMGGLSVYKKGTVNSTVCKFDTFGNALWILKNPSVTPPLVEPIGDGDLVYSGGFTGTAIFTPFTLKKLGSNIWPFIARTTDYRIFRGAVNLGPYCAGDTFTIPYTKDGVYGDSNVFIAEISDADGNFNGGERILGRVNTTKDSSINGVLPLLKLPTSDLYRIRVRSTAPAVQSFFKDDTLHLLVYSRDKADPGSDTSICFGDTFMLSTFGGTTWTWSPSTNMSNSMSRTPLIWPDTATTYKIIIGDTSGCGAPDTASIKITLKALPKITSPTISDSFACIGQKIKLAANFERGIGIYTAHWLDEDYNALKISDLVIRDSFEFTFTKDTLFQLVLTDSCAKINDTARFSIKIKPAMGKKFQTSDTTICHGNLLELSVAYQHLSQDSIKIIWRNSQGDSLSNSFSFEKTIETSDTFYANVNNSCDRSFRLDSVIVISRDTLNTDISGNIDFYCRGGLLDLQSKTIGGNGNFYYQWHLSETQIAKSAILQVSIDSLLLLNPSADSIKINLVVTDSCTSTLAYDSVWVQVKPKLSFIKSAVPDSLCKGNTYDFSFPVTGGNGKYEFQWTLGSNSSKDSLWTFNSALLAPSNYTLFGIVSDNCSTPDTFSKFIVITHPLNVSIAGVLDTIKMCLGETKVFSSIKSGGKSAGYSLDWEVGNTTSTIDNYSLTSTKVNILKDSGFWIRAGLKDGCSNFTAMDSTYVSILNPPISSLSKNNTIGKQTFDTTLCYGAAWRIEPDKYFGKPNLYKHQWLYNTSVIGNSSSLVFDKSIFDGQDSAVRIFYVLSDSCSNYFDTITIGIKVLKALKAPTIVDSLVCFGSSLIINAPVTGGKTGQLLYEWKSVPDNGILSSDTALNLSNNKIPATVVLTVKDNCSSPNYLDTFSISIKDGLAVEVLPKDSCITGNIELKAIGKGGNTNDHQFLWWLNDELQSNNTDQITINNIDSTIAYKTVLIDNCSQASDTFYGTIAPIPRFTYNRLSDSICEPLNHSLNVQALNKDALTYTLFLNDVDQGNINSLLLNMGEYRINIMSSNALECADSIEQTILVKPNPIPAFTFDPKDPNDDNPIVTFTADNPIYTNYQWALNGTLINSNQMFSYQFKDSGEYVIDLMVDLNGCLADSSATIIYRRVYQYYGVNSFSPNGDGVNDVYQPVFTGISELSFSVFNRWGAKVFDSNMGGLSWDGSYRGKPVPSGQYVVLMIVRDVKSTPYSLKESILVLR